MPPECYKNKQANSASDIWATGCIVHQVMNQGETLFRSAVKKENSDKEVI